MLLTALALIATPEPLSPQEIAGIFTADDYPIESLQNGEKGVVSVDADVNPDGRVARCRITKSSGSSRLDSVTCAVITRRARFLDRAKEHGGKPFTIKTTVTWDMRQGGIPLMINVSKIIYSVGPVTTCRIEAPEWLSMPGACEASKQNAQAAIAEMAKERSLEGLEYVIEMASIPGDHLADIRSGEARGEVLLGRQTALLTVAADGRVTACLGGEDTLSGELAQWCESMSKSEVYEPLPASEENRGDRQLTKVNAIYLRPAQPR